MKTWKKVLLVLIVLFIIIQFIRPNKNNSAAAQPANIEHLYATNDDVKNILSKSCYDCHSNNTDYPWYFNIQPVAWWLDSHINEGKQHLNFDEFGNYSAARKYHALQESIEQVKEGEMPLNSYTWIHTDAKLSDAQRKEFIDWCEAIHADLKANYPADSLKMKRPPKPQED